MTDAATSFETILFTVTDGVATVTLNRPDRLNAYNPEMQEELLEAFERVDADDAIRAVVVTGAGRAFCAGSDLAAGGATFDLSADHRADATVPRDGGGILSLRIYECKKFVIAAINGPAVGVGITMTLPMDARIAADDAKIGFVFTRRGITPEACSSWFLPRVVGIAHAMEWTASGRLFGADEAKAAGLVRSIHPREEILTAARTLADEVTAHSAPVSVALTRQLMWRALGAEHPMIAHRAESRALFERGRSQDAYEGLTAFLEKRDAVFGDPVASGLPAVFPDYETPEFH